MLDIFVTGNVAFELFLLLQDLGNNPFLLFPDLMKSVFTVSSLEVFPFSNPQFFYFLRSPSMSQPLFPLKYTHNGKTI